MRCVQGLAFAVVMAAVMMAGFTRYVRFFDFKDIVRLDGQVAIVTGANVGIGLETARHMALHGAHVVLGCRSAKKGQAAVAAIEADLAKADKPGSVEFVPLDLADFDSVAAFVNTFKEKHNKLNVLVNNAGLGMLPFQKSKHGYEMTFQVNHLGHFALTIPLVDVLRATPNSRIVMVSSDAHKWTYADPLDLSTVTNETAYDPALAYGLSKLSNVLFARSLTSKLAKDKIYVNSVHPGFVQTEFLRNVPDTMGETFYQIGTQVANVLAWSAADGALTQLYCATSPEIVEKNLKGEYFIPLGRKGSLADYARSDELAKRLWDFSVEATGFDL